MRLLDRLLRRQSDRVYVRLQYDDGGATQLGPMTHFAAELLLVQRFSPFPYHHERRVRSARIVS